MRLATVSDRAGRTFVAILVRDGFIDLTRHGLMTMADLFSARREWLHEIMSSESPASGEVRLQAPLAPRSVVVTGTNYRSHNAEMGVAGPARPTANLIKFPASVAGPEDSIAIADDCLLDYEAEVAVIVGSQLADADVEAARRAIFGLCLANDLSARDAPTTHLSLAKGGDGYCPLGPWITTLDEVDPVAVTFELAVNGEVRQRGRTQDMIHSIVDIVSSYSHSLPLHPGDVILTGSPSGVGVGMDPPRFLRGGDVVKISSPELGVLINTFRVRTSVGDVNGAGAGR